MEKFSADDSSHLSAGPIFVLGCPRSGTTLLGNLLGNTQWGPAVETQFIFKFQQRAESTDLSDRKRYTRLVRDIVSERAVHQWNIQWDFDRLYDSAKQFNYASLVDQICQLRVDQMGFVRWADKTPNYCLSIERIRALRAWFSNARFVFIIRDGRDVANSLLQKRWGPNNVYSCAQYWNACCESLLQANEEFPESCHLMYYEQLLSRPKDRLLKLFQFLEHESADEIASRCAKEIDSSKAGQWQQRLTARQVEVFERAAGKMLQACKYPTAYQKRDVGLAARVFYRSHDAAKWGAFMFRQNVIDSIKIRFFGKQPFAE